MAAFALLSFASSCGIEDPAGTDTVDSFGSMDSSESMDSSGSMDSSDDTNASDTDAVAPTVTATTPADNALDVALNANIRATFSEPMDLESLTTMSFSVTAGDPPVPVDGVVIYADSVAVFWPSVHLPGDTNFEARISTEAQSSAEIGLAEDYVWSFATGTELEPGVGVELGEAGDFAILAKTGISTVPMSSIVGDCTGSAEVGHGQTWLEDWGRGLG